MVFLTTLMSCDSLIRIYDKGDYEFTISNNTNESIYIESFLKGKSVEKFQIEGMAEIIKYSKDRFNNPSFMIVPEVDSLVIFKEDGSYFQYYCQGKRLLRPETSDCPEVAEGLPNLVSTASCEVVDEIVKGKRILLKCTAEINEEDFRR